MRPTLHSSLAKGLMMALASAALCGCTFTLHERDLLPQPMAPLPLAPAAVAMEKVELVSDGATLTGWLLRSPMAVRTIVYFYGNNGTVLGSAGDAAWLAGTFSADVLLVDYRGHGFSDGRATFAALAADARRTVDFARKKLPGRPLFLFGYSMGTALAVHAAAADRSLAGVVLVAPPTSVEEMAKVFRDRGPWYAKLLRVEVEPSLAAIPQPIQEIAHLDAPLLIVHGTADSTVPFSMGEMMLAGAGAKDKRLCPVPGAEHWSVLTDEGLLRCTSEFFSRR